MRFSNIQDKIKLLPHLLSLLLEFYTKRVCNCRVFLWCEVHLNLNDSIFSLCHIQEIRISSKTVTILKLRSSQNTAKNGKHTPLTVSRQWTSSIMLQCRLTDYVVSTGVKIYGGLIISHHTHRVSC